jgi:hypothetical protein
VTDTRERMEKYTKQVLNFSEIPHKLGGRLKRSF